MKATKKIGIWMDYMEAHLMEWTDPLLSVRITSEFTHQEKRHSLGKSENLMHHQEKQMHAAYFKLLEDNIRTYDEVLLFGPTHAKNELFNLIKQTTILKRLKLKYWIRTI